MAPSAGRPRIEADARARLGAREAALLDALHGGASAEGLDAAQVRRTAAALVAKREGAVRRALPALAHALGGELEPRFAAYARTAPPPAGGALADGLAFAGALRREGLRLPGEARVEVALGRARLARRAPFAALVSAGPPRRLVVVVGAPRGRVRTLTIGGRRQ